MLFVLTDGTTVRAAGCRDTLLCIAQVLEALCCPRSSRRSRTRPGVITTSASSYGTLSPGQHQDTEPLLEAGDADALSTVATAAGLDGTDAPVVAPIAGIAVLDAEAAQ